MKKIVIIILIVLSGCKSYELYTSTTKSYNLIGNVEFISENVYRANYDENLNFTFDTIDPYYFIVNKYFDNNGIIDSTLFLDKDSLLLSKVIYYYSNIKNGIYSRQINKNNKEMNFTKSISFKDSIEYDKKIDFDTKKVSDESWRKFENGKIFWTKSKELKNNLYSESIYIWDNKGLEKEIKTKLDTDNFHKNSIITIKYLEFDKFGNWIKRIELYPAEKKCMVKNRQIKYYN